MLLGATAPFSSDRIVICDSYQLIPLHVSLVKHNREYGQCGYANNDWDPPTNMENQPLQGSNFTTPICISWRVVSSPCVRCILYRSRTFMPVIIKHVVWPHKWYLKEKTAETIMNHVWKCNMIIFNQQVHFPQVWFFKLGSRFANDHTTDTRTNTG